MAMKSLIYRRSRRSGSSRPEASMPMAGEPAIGALCSSESICSVAPRPPQDPGAAARSLFHRRVEGALDLENVVLIEAVDFDDGSRRVRSFAPKLLLDLVHERAKSKHVGDINDDAHAVAQARSLRLGNHLHVE